MNRKGPAMAGDFLIVEDRPAQDFAPGFGRSVAAELAGFIHDPGLDDARLGEDGTIGFKHGHLAHRVERAETPGCAPRP